MSEAETSGEVDAVVFDIGNVLLKFDYLVAARRLVDLGGLNELPARGPVVTEQEALERGDIDRAEFLRRVRPMFRHVGTDEEFVAVWQRIFEENVPMTRLATELAATGVPTYLLSNISCIHVEHIFATYPVFRTFHGAIFSYRVGALKPDPAIYSALVGEQGVTPKRTLFVDDLAENVAAGEAAGFRGLVYNWRDHAPAEATIRRLLKKVRGPSG